MTSFALSPQETLFSNRDLILLLTSARYLPNLWDVIRLSRVNRRLREVIRHAHSDVRLFWTVNDDFTMVHAHRSADIPLGKGAPCSLDSHADYQRPDKTCKHDSHNGCPFCYDEMSTSRLNAQLACKALQRYSGAFYILGNYRVALAFRAMSGMRGEDDIFSPARLLKHGHIDLTRWCLRQPNLVPLCTSLIDTYRRALLGGDAVNRVVDALAIVPRIVHLSQIESKNVFLRGAVDACIQKGVTARMLAGMEQDARFLTHLGKTDTYSLFEKLMSRVYRTQGEVVLFTRGEDGAPVMSIKPVKTERVCERNIDGAVFLFEMGCIERSVFYDTVASCLVHFVLDERGMGIIRIFCNALFARTTEFFDWPAFVSRVDVHHAIKTALRNVGCAENYARAAKQYAPLKQPKDFFVRLQAIHDCETPRDDNSLVHTRELIAFFVKVSALKGAGVGARIDTDAAQEPLNKRAKV